jgi:hypothetical protein
MDFVTNANSGVIQPTSQQIFPSVSPYQQRVAPFGSTRPALSPRTAINQLATASPVASSQPLMTQPAPLFPTAPQPVTVLPTVQQTLNFPNMFTAADGLSYQIIVLTVPLPRIGQKVTLTVGDNAIDYAITDTNKDGLVNDIILTRIISPPTEGETAPEPEMTQAVIINGRWQIFGYNDIHTLVFHQ